VSGTSTTAAKAAADAAAARDTRPPPPARIRWLCGRARGERLLDAASSGGAAALILAREGSSVVAVERDGAALERARELLEAEPRDVRERVRLLGRLAVEDDAFDTVLLGQALEDEDQIEPSLENARRALAADGAAVITVPYGSNGYLDRDEPAHLRPLLRALSRSYAIEDVEVGHGFLGIVARVEPDSQARTDVGPWLDALESAHRRLADREHVAAAHDEELEERDRSAAAQGRALDRATDRAERLERRRARLEESQQEARRRAADAERRLSRQETELAKAKAEVDRRKEQMDRLRASRSFRLVQLLWSLSGAAQRRLGRARAARGGTSSGS